MNQRGTARELEEIEGITMEGFIKLHGKSVIHQVVNPLLQRRSFPSGSPSTSRIAWEIQMKLMVPALSEFGTNALQDLLDANGAPSPDYKRAMGNIREMANQVWPRKKSIRQSQYGDWLSIVVFKC